MGSEADIRAERLACPLRVTSGHLFITTRVRFQRGSDVTLASKNRTGCEPSREKPKDRALTPAIAAVLLVRFSLKKCLFGGENAHFVAHSPNTLGI